jgi:hypothetical protein
MGIAPARGGGVSLRGLGPRSVLRTSKSPAWRLGIRPSERDRCAHGVARRADRARSSGSLRRRPNAQHAHQRMRAVRGSTAPVSRPISKRLPCRGWAITGLTQCGKPPRLGGPVRLKPPSRRDQREDRECDGGFITLPRAAAGRGQSFVTATQSTSTSKGPVHSGTQKRMRAGGFFGK